MIYQYQTPNGVIGGHIAHAGGIPVFSGIIQE